jgi:hypothetical protein
VIPAVISRTLQRKVSLWALMLPDRASRRMITDAGRLARADLL